MATDSPDFAANHSSLELPESIRFLVVDGQHRLWAQKFSEYEASYACVIHMGLTEVDMARLFLEINDNQKRVPSSLRWDLVRLVRPDDDPYAIGAAELVYLLATERESPLFQRIDLTGEQPEIQLKQGSLAPEIRLLLGKRSPLHGMPFDEQYQILLHYILAIRALDPDRWSSSDSPFYRARVLRALLRLLPDLLRHIAIPLDTVKYGEFLPHLQRIEASSLDPQEIRANQGSAGIKAIYDQIHQQVFTQGQ